MKWLNYHHLIYFREIANEGGISKAAKKLLIGQPALSAQLKQLENYLGHDLFERKNRKLILTDAGKVVLKYANKIGDLGNELLDVLEDQSFTSKIKIQIGVLDSIPKELIYRLSKFARDNFDVSISVLEGTGQDLFNQLKLHQLDLVIANYHGEVAQMKGIQSRLLKKDTVSIYGAQEMKGLKKNFPESIDGEHFILPTVHSKLRMDIERYFTNNNIKYEVGLETQDMALQRLFGIKGTGLIPLADYFASSLVKNKKLYKIGTLEDVYEEYCLFSTPRIIDNPVAEEIIKNFKL